jgi:hypothetical protein
MTYSQRGRKLLRSGSRKSQSDLKLEGQVGKLSGSTYTVDVPGMPGVIYVALIRSSTRQSLIPALNRGSPFRGGEYVDVEYDPQLDQYFVKAPTAVIDEDSSAPSPEVQPHRHYIGSGYEDPVEDRRFEPGLVHRSSGLVVGVEPFWYPNVDSSGGSSTVIFFPGGTFDLEPYLPTDPHLQKWIIVGIDTSTGDIAAEDGGIEINLDVTLDESVIELIDWAEDFLPLAAIRVKSNQTAAPKNADYRDLRNHAGRLFSVPWSAPPPIGNVTPNTGTFTTLVAQDTTLKTLNVVRLDDVDSIVSVGKNRDDARAAALELYANVSASTTVSAYIQRQTGADGIFILFNSGNGDTYFWNNGSGAIKFFTSAADKFSIANSGDLSVHGDLLIVDGMLEIRNDDDTAYRDIRLRHVELTQAAGNERRIHFLTGTTNRWVIYADSVAESGSNAGSNLRIDRFTDAGTGGTGLVINRASGETEGVFFKAEEFRFTSDISEPTVDGAIGISTRDAIVFRPSAGPTQLIPGVLWTPTGSVADITATTGASLSAAIGSGTLTIPANSWIHGRILRINIRGYITSNAAGTGRSNLDILIGSTTVVSADTTVMPVTLTRPFEWIVEIRCTAVGSPNGTFERVAIFNSPALGECRTDLNAAVTAPITSSQNIGIQLYFTNTLNTARIQSLSVEWIN